MSFIHCLRSESQLTEKWISPSKMAVKLSACQFKQPNLVRIITKIFNQTDLNANHLKLDLTESVIIKNVLQTITILPQLHDMGIVLSLDDFGTGYSSLNYLKHFPIDAAKIDQSFVPILFLTQMMRRLQKPLFL